MGKEAMTTLRERVSFADAIVDLLTDMAAQHKEEEETDVAALMKRSVIPIGCSNNSSQLSSVSLPVPEEEQQGTQGRSIVIDLEVVAIILKNIPEKLRRNGIFTHLTLPYTTRAFGETLATQTVESREEHFEHSCGCGDVMLLIGGVSCLPSSSSSLAIRGVGHLLLQRINITNNKAETKEEDEASSSTGMHCIGMCVDPLAQGRGIATVLYTAAITALPVDEALSARPLRYVTARTASKAVVKLFLNASSQKHVNNTTATTTPDVSPRHQPVFPFHCVTESDWHEARTVAQAVIQQVEHSKDDVAAFEPKTLTFRKVYTPDRQAVFAPSSPPSSGTKDDASPSSTTAAVATSEVEKLIAQYARVDEGDALLLVQKLF